MAFALPGWVVDNHTSVEREAAPYRHMSFDERAAHLAAACRTAARMLASRPDAAKVYQHRDPIPESTRRALARLRAEEQRRSRR